MRGVAGDVLQGFYLSLLGPRPGLKSRRAHLIHDEFLAAAHELIECPDGSDWPFNVDIYRQTDPRKIDIPLEASYRIDSIDDFGNKWPAIEEIIRKVDHDQLTIIIEQQRFQDDRAPPFYEDLARLAREIPGELKRVSWHRIYSYFGQREINPRYLAFKNAVTKLLNIDPTSDWSFLVDIHLPDRILPPQRFTRAKYRNDFLALRDQYLLGAHSKAARIFVRHVGGYAPSQLNVVEPPVDNLQIVRLLHSPERAKTYWKIPSDLKAEYCINSLQPAFVRALLAIFGRDRPYRNVRLSSKQRGVNSQRLIGFGGMEVTREVWDWVRYQIGEQQNNPPEAGANPLACELDVVVPALDPGVKSEDALSLHLIGDDYDRDMVFNRKQYNLIYSYILERLTRRHKQKPDSSYPNGSSIAMWFSAIEREENYPPVILQVDRRDSDEVQSRKLKEAFTGRVQSFSNIWFRPEYRVFTIRDHKEPARVWQWNTTDEQHNTTLENFRENIRQMYDDWDPIPDANFILIQPHANRLFVVDRRTTENYWRKYIFDWITETDIYIERRGVRSFMQPDTIPWGYRHTRQAPAAPPVEPNPVPVAPVVGPSQQPRINKTRLILPVAEKPIIPKWETWMTDQHRKDALQRRSYIQDQSVIEPGLDPSAPTYGPSKELSLGVSLSTPTVYMQRLTATDIMHLAEENQKLRNGLLERTYNCPICSVSMPGYEHAEIQRHYAQHLVQLQKEGQCPLCERESWSIMTMEQKKEHLETHQVEVDTEMIRNFWNDIECPVCDAKMSGFKAEQVLRHMADHLPGIIEFCDKCGLRTAICNHAELVHHRYTCLDKPDRGPLDQEPSFCGDCGQNRTAEDEGERGLHVVNCTAKNRHSQDKKFCTKCGIDKSSWSKNEIATHDDHCTTPQGSPKAFCLRCGTKLIGLNAEQLDDHRVFCSIRTKEPETLRQRIEELKVRAATSNRVAAKNAAAIAWLTKQMADVQSREHALAEKEAHLPLDKREVIPWAEDTKDLGKCPWSSQGCDYYTVGKTRGDIFTHMASHFEPNNAIPFDCPFPNCGKKVAAPGSEPGKNIHIVDHYRHRHDTGIADVLSAPKISTRIGPARDPNKLHRLLEHFRRANAMNALTEERNRTALPELGSGRGQGGSGGGAISYQHDEGIDVQPSVEADDFFTGDYESPPAPTTPRSPPRHQPKSRAQPPNLPVTPTKRRAPAAIPDEQLSPISTRHAPKRARRDAVQKPSPESELPRVIRRSTVPSSSTAAKVGAGGVRRGSRGTGADHGGEGIQERASLEEDTLTKEWDDLMKEFDDEAKRLTLVEAQDKSPEPEPEAEAAAAASTLRRSGRVTRATAKGRK
ncbi:hypothetical protein DSL72_008141 [Monilinia vaccinii-corymbosi]|uniref:C2H2-type domain-containing protein n=1 Tax=Monilinia vaccinii-corymbosi TaxID=61207 RepID=A0A8A3PJ04_9HELO|nr:hypothetical protein DSL72_008141 [Monilinia vaccinii-corymbosi]